MAALKRPGIRILAPIAALLMLLGNAAILPASASPRSAGAQPPHDEALAVELKNNYIGIVYEHGTPLPAPLTPQPSFRNTVQPLFGRLFHGERPLGNWFDHDQPLEWHDANGYQVTWYQRRTGGTNGHNGYDWLMPTGTPLLAIGDGRVVRSGLSVPFYCPLKGGSVNDSLGVDILHTAPDGRQYRISMSHMSRAGVKWGQQVKAGDQIGLSGNSGCSLVPHVHLSVSVETKPGVWTKIDPYGWESVAPDPWEHHPQGARSVWLWKDGEAPSVYREEYHPYPAHVDARAPLRITVLRWMAWKDLRRPNGQFVQIEVDRSSSEPFVNLTGLRLENNNGDRFTFPNGSRVEAERPLRVHVGAGADTGTRLFWRRPQGIWDPMGDCVRLIGADGRVIDSLSYLGAPCGVKK